ncbi:hypothetical protein MTO96_000777 [Rhipicephalus appendiculatus]
MCGDSADPRFATWGIRFRQLGNLGRRRLGKQPPRLSCPLLADALSRQRAASAFASFSPACAETGWVFQSVLRVSVLCFARLVREVAP